jgi:hypothetical protein
MLATAICGLTGHKINRRRVWNDNVNFRTDCERCGTAMVRDLSGWVPYDPDHHGGTGHDDGSGQEELAHQG